jgi:hypothetical protein
MPVLKLKSKMFAIGGQILVSLRLRPSISKLDLIVLDIMPRRPPAAY